ncbi:MAG: glycosyltransferase family 2 protein [Syntrophobacterales bacterium]|jgi:dolichol-phosphate mannosyltransferase
MRIVIIIPTYNEAENIEPLLAALRTQTRELPHQVLIMVVDDNSPDGTADRVRAMMASDPEVHLLTGEKQGLGEAYIRGMRYALDTLGAEAVLEMDADFSHKPEDVPRLIAALEANADFVIGSRYVSGGSIPDNWGWWRRLLSRGGNIFARYVAGLHRVRDCTAGFRAIRASLLRKIDFSKLGVQGYAFQIALLNQALAHGAQVKEVPVACVDLVKGETKLSLSEIVEFFLNVGWIRFQTSTTFLKFGTVGLSGVVVNVGSFVLLMKLGLNKFLASPIAIELSFINNFLLNNYWTFGRRNTKDRFMTKGLKFKGVSLLALVVSYSTFLLLSFLFPKTSPAFHQLVAIIPATAVNYLLNAYWTFKEKDAAPNRQPFR